MRYGSSLSHFLYNSNEKCKVQDFVICPAETHFNKPHLSLKFDLIDIEEEVGGPK